MADPTVLQKQEILDIIMQQPRLVAPRGSDSGLSSTTDPSSMQMSASSKPDVIDNATTTQQPPFKQEQQDKKPTTTASSGPYPMSPPKKKRTIPIPDMTNYQRKKTTCACCHTAETPLWRRGPNGATLCNGCGIRWLRYQIYCGQCNFIPTRTRKNRMYCPHCDILLVGLFRPEDEEKIAKSLASKGNMSAATAINRHVAEQKAKTTTTTTKKKKYLGSSSYDSSDPIDYQKQIPTLAVKKEATGDRSVKNKKKKKYVGASNLQAAQPQELPGPGSGPSSPAKSPEYFNSAVSAMISASKMNEDGNNNNNNNETDQDSQTVQLLASLAAKRAGAMQGTTTTSTKVKKSKKDKKKYLPTGTTTTSGGVPSLSKKSGLARKKTSKSSKTSIGATKAKKNKSQQQQSPQKNQPLQMMRQQEQVQMHMQQAAYPYANQYGYHMPPAMMVPHQQLQQSQEPNRKPQYPLTTAVQLQPHEEHHPAQMIPSQQPYVYYYMPPQGQPGVYPPGGHLGPQVHATGQYPGIQQEHAVAVYTQHAQGRPTHHHLSRQQPLQQQHLSSPPSPVAQQQHHRMMYGAPPQHMHQGNGQPLPPTTQMYSTTPHRT